MKYPDYVPIWYNPEESYRIMKKYGDKSKELKDYMENGIMPKGDANVTKTL